ncbi:MAG: hypothetical protein AABW93_02100 [Nanoarchaeota archaeon]
MAGKIVIAILLLAVIVGGVFLFNTVSKNPVKTAGVINNPDENSQGVQTSEEVIEITSSGLIPATIEISKGDTVTWVNKDVEKHWPASAIHPTHRVYPGSDIEKCGTGEEKSIFDSCRGLATGESWSFTFNEVGSWSYHDHLVNGLFGKVIVLE